MNKTQRKTASRSPGSRASGLDRRSFFKAATLGLGAGVAATAIDAATGAPAEAAEPESPDGGRYRLTDHVRRAYALARF